MRVPRTYRARLVGYTGLLLAFLATTLVLSYRSSSALVLKEARDHAERTAQFIGQRLHIESSELAERARMMRDNPELAGYFYIAASLGTDPGALRDVYRRHFGWLQIDRAVVMSSAGKVFVGAEHEDLREALVSRGLPSFLGESRMVWNHADGLEVVATASINYRSQHLGVIAITRKIGLDWMQSAQQLSGGHLLLVRDQQVVMSTNAKQFDGVKFLPSETGWLVGDELHLVQQVPTDSGDDSARLWFSLSKNELNANLRELRDRMLWLIALGCFSVLLVGLAMLHNFSTPLTRLLRMMQEVSAGRLPDIPRTPSPDEIGYLTNRFSEMVASLREQRQAVKEAQAELEREATTDALTGLYNRRYLYELYPKLWSEAQRHQRKLTLTLIDLDHFKRVNDRHGHLVGDEVLRHAARLMRVNSRVSDFLFRIGGEEFLILTSGGDDGGQSLAEKIRGALESEPCRADGQTIAVTASFGVAESEAADGVEGLSRALDRADQALYTAKQSGRNRVAVWFAQRHSA